MIFQEPMTSLNPVYTIGDQVAETRMLHQKMKRRQAWERVVEMLHMVGIPSPESRVHDYPHQLSCGMRQRVMIAIAMACNPEIMIADEPTTALDVTIQAQILRLLNRLQNLEPPTEGEVHFRGQRISGLGHRAMKPFRGQMQMLFQDPYSSLNPRKRIRQIIEELLIVHGWRNKADRLARVQELMEVVGLRPEMIDRFPHEFSGGQRQRVGIARAMALRPTFLVCDEPVSALDLSIQAQVINLMIDLQEQFQLTYLLISHDLSVVQFISTRIGVMYLGNCWKSRPVGSFTGSPSTRIPAHCSPRLPFQTPMCPFLMPSLKETCPAPSRLRPAAIFTRAAPRPGRAAASRCPCCGKWARHITWRVIGRDVLDKRQLEHKFTRMPMR